MLHPSTSHTAGWSYVIYGRLYFHPSMSLGSSISAALCIQPKIWRPVCSTLLDNFRFTFVFYFHLGILCRRHYIIASESFTREASFSATISVTRVDNSWKFFNTNFLTKVAQLYNYFVNNQFISKTCCGYLLGNFWKKLGYFLFQHLVPLALLLLL